MFVHAPERYNDVSLDFVSEFKVLCFVLKTGSTCKTESVVFNRVSKRQNNRRMFLVLCKIFCKENLRKIIVLLLY